MSRASALDVNGMALGAAAAIGAALAAWFALSALARPPGVSARLAEVTRQADETGRLKARLKGPSAYPAGAVCDGGADAGVGMFRQTLTTLAGQSGFAVGNLEARPQTPDEANGGLQPIEISIDGAGPAQALTGLLQALSTSTPSLFVDKLDLRPSEGAVALKLSGHIFCSPVRP